MAGAMVWTIIADVIPVSERTTMFNQVNALALSFGVSVQPVSAYLLNYDPWLPMWIGFGFLAAGTLSVLLIPETLRLQQEADDERRRAQGPRDPGQSEEDHNERSTSIKHNIMKQAWFTVKNDMGHVWRFIFASRSIMLLIVSFAICYPIRLAI